MGVVPGARKTLMDAIRGGVVPTMDLRPVPRAGREPNS
jgi:hypothetical protein